MIDALIPCWDMLNHEQGKVTKLSSSSTVLHFKAKNCSHLQPELINFEQQFQRRLILLNSSWDALFSVRAHIEHFWFVWFQKKSFTHQRLLCRALLREEDLKFRHTRKSVLLAGLSNGLSNGLLNGRRKCEWAELSCSPRWKKWGITAPLLIFLFALRIQSIEQNAHDQ